MKLLSGTVSIPQNIRKILAVIVALAIVGLSVVSHYGITWDEPIEVDMVEWNQQYIKENKTIPEGARYYGFIFNYISHLAYNGQQAIAPQLNPDFIPNKRLNYWNQRWLAKMWRETRVKHYVIFLFSLIAYLAVVGIVAILAGIEHAWLGALILALFPSFWGHSFFNPKDIPFATVFTLGTFCGTLLLNAYFQAETQRVKLGWNRLTLYTGLYGVLVGIVAGVRIGGFFLLFYLIFAHLATKPQIKSIKITLFRFWSFYLLIILLWALTLFAIQPASWRNPIEWFLAAVTQMSKFNLWDNTVLFDGQNIPGRSLPWYYLPRLLTLTTPVLWQIAFGIGVVAILARMPKFSPTQRACAILTLLQVFVLPILAIVRQSTLYDGIRHFLFILPPMAAIATTTLIWAYHKINQKSIKIFAIALLLVNLTVIASDMIALHPYEYTYYNRAYGGLRAAHGQQETDYWGLSFTDAMDWINQNVPANASIVVSGPMFAAEMVQDPEKNFRMIHRDNFPWGKAPDPDYYLALSRYDYFQAFPQCPIIHAVTRQDTPLSIVKRCRTP